MKTRTVATCQSCGAQMPRWMGRCPDCGEWGTVVEEPIAPKRSGATPAATVSTEMLLAHDLDTASHIPTGIEEVDRVLGGGLVRGSIVLLAGEPGVGKSTLVLQVAAALGAAADVLIVCGEEAPQQVRARASRLGPVPESVRTLATPELGAVLGAMGSTDVLVVDSIQTVFDPDIPSAPGSVSQVRECGARLARVARDNGVTVVLVGHVTKEGAVAGPRVLEHIVDVVLQFEGDRSSGVRVLRAMKNRFGSTQDVGFFEMGTEGLVAIRDASAYLLADRCGGLPGSVLAACVDGQRPFVCEIQALVMKSSLPAPRRTAIGVDPARLPMLLAVLEQRAQVALHGHDVYVTAVGGIKAAEPAMDLPAAMAIMSAVLDTPLADDVVAFGEIGLSGQIRQVTSTERRLIEARSVGCGRAFVPSNYTGSSDGIELQRIRHVRVALEAIAK